MLMKQVQKNEKGHQWMLIFTFIYGNPVSTSHLCFLKIHSIPHYGYQPNENITLEAKERLKISKANSKGIILFHRFPFLKVDKLFVNLMPIFRNNPMSFYAFISLFFCIMGLSEFMHSFKFTDVLYSSKKRLSMHNIKFDIYINDVSCK